MILLEWLLPVVTAFGAGYLLVDYLTVHPVRMSRSLLLACTVAAAWLLQMVLLVDEAPALGVFLASLAAFAAGYMLATRAMLNREDPRPVPGITRQRGDPGMGHTAVVYFTHGEPETYDPIGWINQFKEFDSQKIPFVPFVARPLFIRNLRNSYLKVGASRHRQIHGRMIRMLEAEYRRQGDASTRFYLSFLDDNPRPDAAVIQALNEGASDIVVAEVFVSVSNHTAEGEELIRAVDVEAYGATLRFTRPLWDSEILQRMMVARTNGAIGDTPRDRVGVLLVGHGQPDEWDRQWPTETEHEMEFRIRTLERFAEAGYVRQNLSLAWMEFKDPKPAEIVDRFHQDGVEKVVYFSAAISADSLHSQIDVPELVNQARSSREIPILNLGAWNDDPMAIQAIKERIDEQLVEIQSC
jgi:protoheme ferro-lyase